MGIRSGILAAALGVCLVAPAASFAQRQRGGGPISGVVKSIDTGAKTVTVTIRGRQGMEQDVTIKTDAQTIYGIAGGDAATFSDVKTGRTVVVLGQGTPQEGVTARNLVVFEKPVVVVRGAVKSADTAAKTVIITAGTGGNAREVTVTTTDKTKLMGLREAAKWEDLAAGRRVFVVTEGTARDPKVAATYIWVLPAAAGGGQ